MNSYRDLPVWQKAIDLVALCHTLTQSFPGGETSGVGNQIRRAASSVVGAIAEGEGQENAAFVVQCLRPALGSLKETETHLSLAGRIGLLEQAALQQVMLTCDEIRTMLRSQILAIEEKQ